MSNLAYEVQRQNQQMMPKPSKRPLISPTVQTRGVTKGEKILWVSAAVILLAGAVWIIANYASIYSSALSNQKLEQKIALETKKTEDYKLQVTELSAPERMFKIAKEQGFKLDDKNVKVVQN
ncbi:cell division protein FtsL [Fictibacillus iocasae]|uniref:Cell division protein FtsL n=1 Tax=Fictibacillus iocasae TaxID=2715437 RepID=A0ABW2NQH8_9BACL